MNLLLDGDKEVLKILRQQYKHSKVTKVSDTGYGIFIDFQVEKDVITINGSQKQNFAFGDVYAVVNGVTGAIGFVLFVKEGRISMLEGYSNIPNA